MEKKLIIFLLLINASLGLPLSKKNFLAKKFFSEEKPNSKKVIGNISFEADKNIEPIEEDLKLIDIHGDAYTNNTSLLNLKFNKEVNVNYFSKFYLTDIKPYLSYAYFLNFTFYKSKNNSSIDCLFDFKRVPAGSYLLNFVYKNITHPTNITLNVKEEKD